MGRMQIEKFINNVKNITSLSEIENRVKQEKSYIDTNYTTVGSRKYTFTQYRNFLKETPLRASFKTVILNI